MNILGDFFTLCEVLDDDLDLVAELIHKHHNINEKLSHVKDDVTECSLERIAKYHATINKLLDMPIQYFKKHMENKNSNLFD